MRTIVRAPVPSLRYIRPQSTSRLTRVLPGTAAKGDPMPEGYCVKERKKVEIKDAKQVTMKNGRPAIQGTCPDCGTKIFKIGKLE
jgi:Domain of unknown function (DUF5679)